MAAVEVVAAGKRMIVLERLLAAAVAVVQVIRVEQVAFMAQVLALAHIGHNTYTQLMEAQEHLLLVALVVLVMRLIIYLMIQAAETIICIERQMQEALEAVWVQQEMLVV